MCCIAQQVTLAQHLGCADAAHVELFATLVAHHHCAGEIGLAAAVAHRVIAGACNGECCAFDCHVVLVEISRAHVGKPY